MKLRHNSRSPQFRTPFGAVKLGTKVRLSCTVEDIDPQLVACTLRLWIDGEGEELVPMEYGEESVFSAEITRETPAIVWYSFIVKATDQAELRIGAAPGKQGGEGVVYDYQEVPPSSSPSTDPAHSVLVVRRRNRLPGLSRSLRARWRMARALRDRSRQEPMRKHKTYRRGLGYAACLRTQSGQLHHHMGFLRRFAQRTARQTPPPC